MRNNLLAIALGLLLLPSCTKTFTEDCSGSAKSFAVDVLPLVQSSCATSSGCHATGSNEGPGALTNYGQISGSKSSVKSSVSNGKMPPGGGLSDAQKSAIICWVNQGGLNN